MVGDSKSAKMLNTYDMAKQRKERNISGTYMEFLDDRSKRLKKPFQGYPADGAGLLHGSRWHGREQPSKGKVPLKPADGKESPYTTSRPKSVADRSYLPTDVLLMRPATAPSPTPKPAKKFLPDSSFTSHLEGGAVHVNAEEARWRRSKGKGADSPDITVTRTRRHMVNDGLSREVSVDPKDLGRKCMTLMGRPMTADSFLSHKYQPRDDYRSSTLETARNPNPAIQPYNQNASKEVFFNSFNDYCVNKSRAIYGGRFRCQ